jgi:nucleotidyltransferase substrate binding protein (TIGR01987 family)
MSKLYNLKISLKTANDRLKEVLEMEETQVNQDATIQRFEFCFELAWKLMQEYTRDQGFDCNSPKSSIREAGKLEIVDDVEKWLIFLQSRNNVAHMYNAEMAKIVFKEAKKLPMFIDKILKKIE